MNDWINLHALWQIVVIGLIAGAGLPALFAVGLRALAQPRAGQPALASDSDKVVGGSAVGMSTAVVCFAIVLAGIGWGVYFIVAGS
jgi:hypothetical protein